MNEWLERYKTYIVLALGIMLAMGGVFFWLNRPQPAPITISTPVPTATPTLTPIPTLALVRIYISGAVRKPDVYVLPPGSIVKDAVAAAGGTTADADMDRINLALALHDQQQIYVPRQGETDPPAPPPTGGQPLAPPSSTSKVNINTASLEELDTLPGIGPAIAQRIIDYRTANGPFAAIEDLVQVKGIGPATFEKLQDKITTQ